MNVLRRLAYKVIQRMDRARSGAAVRLPGISEIPASARTWVPAPEPWVSYPLDLDIGEVADGYRLIARSISLSATYLLFQYAFAPEPAADAEVWLNMFYDADVSRLLPARL